MTRHRDSADSSNKSPYLGKMSFSTEIADSKKILGINVSRVSALRQKKYTKPSWQRPSDVQVKLIEEEGTSFSAAINTGKSKRTQDYHGDFALAASVMTIASRSFQRFANSLILHSTNRIQGVDLATCDSHYRWGLDTLGTQVLVANLTSEPGLKCFKASAFTFL